MIVIHVPFYHGKSPVNHHMVGIDVTFFPIILMQIQVSTRIFWKKKYLFSAVNLMISLELMGFGSFWCWLCLVPLKGGIGGIVHPPIGRIFTIYIYIYHVYISLPLATSLHFCSTVWCGFFFHNVYFEEKRSWSYFKQGITHSKITHFWEDFFKECSESRKMCPKKIQNALDNEVRGSRCEVRIVHGLGW